MLQYSLGDINNDGNNDLVLLLKENNKNKYLGTMKYGVYIQDYNPQFLLIYLYNSKKSKYIFYKKLKNLIPVNSVSFHNEFSITISIKNNKLNLNYFFWNNYYSCQTKEKTYTFKYLSDIFFLVKIKDFYQHRIYNYFKSEELDFLRNKRIITSKMLKENNEKKTILDLDKSYQPIKITEIIPFEILIEDSYY